MNRKFEFEDDSDFCDLLPPLTGLLTILKIENEHRYVVTTFVDASNPTEALRLAKKLTPHEVYLHSDSWKESGYPLKESDKKRVGV